MYESNNHLLILPGYSDPGVHSHKAAHLIVSLGQKMTVFSGGREYICRKTNRYSFCIPALWCGRDWEAAGEKNALFPGEYGCRGYNTYGPWKLIGGMNKGHPSAEELAGAVLFFGSFSN